MLRYGAPECMVLLKSKGDFPLPTPGKLALYGSGARNTVKGGTGSGDVNSRFYYTAEMGLEEAGFTITTKAWMDAYDTICQKAREDLIRSVKAEARQKHMPAVILGMGAVVLEPEYDLPLDGEGDAAVYVLSRKCGEGNDRKNEKGDYQLTDTEVRDILACQEKYPHFLLALNVGGQVDLTPVLAVENILLMSQLGVVSGQALADVLLGHSFPSGKLTDTWAPYDTWAQAGEFGGQDDTRYTEGVYVGYRYFDVAGVTPTFPFGYGLGYTSFDVTYEGARLDGAVLTVTARVANTGARPGKETVQLYVSAPWGRLDHPVRELCAFAKTRELLPNNSQRVTLTVPLERVASYDEASAAYFLEAGRYLFSLGVSVADAAPCCAVEVARETVTRQLTNVGGKPDFIDWRPQARPPIEAEVPVLTLAADAFANYPWPAPAALDEKSLAFVQKLSDEDLCQLTIGRHKDGPAVASIIGNAAFAVAGAAGESCERVAGVPAVVMADGPAGLRLARSYELKNGRFQSLDASLVAGLSDFLPGFVNRLTGGGQAKTPKGQVHHQYCTAIPIGTALAQSWNLEIAEVCGDMVGTEMALFGVHQWLAPALNIHRSPLCGRNFEYFSEDPLVGGLVSAALCRGVQAHPGRAVTIKHFCVNNQETNRYQSNSQVSERALREIYLKGFELCIREGAPLSLMTSYNLLNGVHTSERADLLKTVLRDEWGWEDLVVSDWVIGLLHGKGRYPTASAARSIQAGNDVFMPGSGDNYREVLAALKGKNPAVPLTRREVEYCAAHLAAFAWRLTR